MSAQARRSRPARSRRRLRLALAQARIEADPDVWKQLNELPEDSPLTISIDDSAVADLAAGFAVKRCDRQVRDRGDLWCDASSANDKTASGQIEGRVVAPTSTPICAACDVPDSRIRCTAFMHPEVTGVRAFGGTHERSLNWAICDAGHQDRITGAPQLCIPESGHECWFRDVTIGPRDPSVNSGNMSDAVSARGEVGRRRPVVMSQRPLSIREICPGRPGQAGTSGRFCSPMRHSCSHSPSLRSTRVPSTVGFGIHSL